ncbi:MAG: hypothetical protein ACJ702_06980 [Nitrososphaeraceae archaeon]
MSVLLIFNNFNRSITISDRDVSDKSVKEKTNELKTDMDLKEVVSLLVLVDPVRSVLKTHATRLSFIGEDKALDQMVEEKINELKKNHTTLAGILERFHKMDLKDTAIGLLGIDAM